MLSLTHAQMLVHVISMKIVPLVVACLASQPVAAQRFCGMIEDSLYRSICECRELEGSTERLDCYDHAANDQENSRAATRIILNRLAETPGVLEVIQEFAKERDTSPRYRWDPDTGGIIPLNEAAREEHENE